MNLKILPALCVTGALVLGCTTSATKNPGVSMRTAVEKTAWEGDSVSGQRIASEHYVIFTTDSNQSVVTYLPGFMEAAYGNYLSLTGLPDGESRERMIIYLMGTRQEWEALTRSVTGPQSPVYLSIEAGGYCFRGVGVFWDIGGLGTFAVASHEGLHQFFYHRMKNPLPMWLEEGLCAAAEGYHIDGETVRFDPMKNSLRINDLRAAIIQPQRWIPVRQLLLMDAGDALNRGPEKSYGYYGQLWALAMFLRSRPEYRAGMQRMIADAQAGRFAAELGMPSTAFEGLKFRGKAYNRALSPKLFEHYITADMDAFENQYRQFAWALGRLEPR
jgi:hypothetical protein